MITLHIAINLWLRDRWEPKFNEVISTTRNLISSNVLIVFNYDIDIGTYCFFSIKSLIYLVVTLITIHYLSLLLHNLICKFYLLIFIEYSFNWLDKLFTHTVYNFGVFMLKSFFVSCN